MTYQFKDGPLSTLFSCRHRLSEDERQTLKEAHNAFRQREAKAIPTPVLAGSSISVSTNVEASQASYSEYGFSSIVVNDLITSRDSIAIPVLLKLQKMLGVEVITRKQLDKAAKNYLDYVFSK